MNKKKNILHYVFILTLTIVVRNAYSEETLHLNLVASDGKNSYTAMIDKNGRYTFLDVLPGTYELSFEIDEAFAPASQSQAKKMQRVEIKSFSWNAAPQNTLHNTPAQNGVQGITGSGVVIGDIDGDGLPEVVCNDAPVSGTKITAKYDAKTSSFTARLAAITVKKQTSISGMCVMQLQ